jgi:hypothetical protein
MNRYSFLDVQAFAAQIYGAGKNLSIVPYGYTTTFSALAQNATATNSLNITANADFILLELLHRAQIGAAQTVSTKTAPYVRVLITDSGTNEQFTNAAVDLENYSQNGVGSRSLPFPRFIQGRTALSIQATNYAPTAETYTTVDVFLSGVLVRAL